jgi:hypothetical protein
MNWDTAPDDIARLTAEVERLKLECSIRDAMLAERRGELAASKSAFDALAVQHADRMTQLYAAQADARQASVASELALAAMTAEVDALAIQVKMLPLPELRIDPRTEELLAAMTAERDSFRQSLADMYDERTARLEEAQAREQQLREAVKILLYDYNAGIWRVKEALALPTDDTALRQAKAKVLRDIRDKMAVTKETNPLIFLDLLADELEKKNG